jgi:alkylation response protein AidB-like acyl-CoA dehydrogenase
MRLNALRTLGEPEDGESARSADRSTRGATMRPEAMIGKLYWATWHRALGELAMQIAGMGSEVMGPKYELDRLQRLFLFSRADTIYAGSNEIQRNIIAERALGLPQEPRT